MACSITNDVQLRVNKGIVEDDLDVILMYLENKTKSGGGDIVKHSYDSLNNVLDVIYETSNAKFGVLTKKIHKLLDYLFVSSELVKFKTDLCKILEPKAKCQNTLVLQMIASEDLSVVSIYAEYLVPENEIVNIAISKRFPGMIIVEYKKEINYEQAQKRYLKRNSLRNQAVKLYEAFQMFSYIIESPFDIDSKQLSEKAYFVYVEPIKAFLVVNQSEDITGAEKLYSLEQLKEMLPEQSKPVFVPSPQFVKLKFIEITIENPLFIALLNCKQILADFNANLAKINAVLRQINEKLFKIDYDKQVNDENHDVWLRKVEFVIEHFEKFINFAQIKLPNAGNLAKSVEDCISMLNKSKSDLYIYSNNSFIILIGYENSVKYSYNTINVLSQQLPKVVPQQQQPPKVMPQQQQPTFRIDIEPNLANLFRNCIDLFNSVQNVLKASNAKLSANNASIVQINANIGGNELTWKNLVRDEFNKFIIETIRLHKVEIPVEIANNYLMLVKDLSAKVNKNRVYFFLEHTTFNIIGHFDEVNNMVVQLNEYLRVHQQQQQQQLHAVVSELFTTKIDDGIFKNLLLECQNIFEDLNLRLKSANAQLISNSIQSLIVTQIKPLAGESKPHWLEKVNETIAKFYQVQITFEKLESKYFDVSLLNKYKSEVANNKAQNFVYQISPPNDVIFCGFKRSVNKVVAYLKGATANVPQAIAISKVATVNVPQIAAKTVMEPKLMQSIEAKDETIEIDYHLSQTLINCPQLYSKLLRKLSGCNAILVFD